MVHSDCSLSVFEHVVVVVALLDAVVEAVFNPKTKNLEGNVVSYLNKREWLND